MPMKRDVLERILVKAEAVLMLQFLLMNLIALGYLWSKPHLKPYYSDADGFMFSDSYDVMMYHKAVIDSLDPWFTISIMSGFVGVAAYRIHIWAKGHPAPRDVRFPLAFLVIISFLILYYCAFA